MVARSLTFNQAGEESYICRLPSPRGQTHPNLVQLVPQHLVHRNIIVMERQGDDGDGLEKAKIAKVRLATLPPSLDLALLRTPPRREAFRHSGGDKRRCTSATVT